MLINLGWAARWVDVRTKEASLYWFLFVFFRSSSHLLSALEYLCLWASTYVRPFIQSQNLRDQLLYWRQLKL